MSEDAGFLSRWSRRKAEVKEGRVPLPEPVAERELPSSLPAQPALPTQPARAELVEGPAHAPGQGLRQAQPERVGTPAPLAPAPPAPTLDDVQALAPGDEVSRFVARGVDESVKRAAVKKLFTDPHFNIMDGLDIYIDDYSLPDPIPMAMLRQLNQAKFMGLFAAEEAAEAAEAAQAEAARRSAEPLASNAQAATPATSATTADEAAEMTHPTEGERPALGAPLSPPPIFAKDADAASPMLAVVPQAPDEDPDLQLQPNLPARRPGA